MNKKYTLKHIITVVFICNIITLFGQTTTENITVSGNWTCPPGVTTATIECWGGGGAGGGASTASPVTGGGGSGGAYTKLTMAVTPLTSYPVNIGTGGVGGAGNGGNGGNTWFINASTLMAVGGLGGNGSNTTTPGAGAAAVTSGNIGGTVNWYGGAGGTGTPNPNPTISGAGGGSANFNADGTSAIAGVPGSGAGTGGAGIAGNANGAVGAAPGAGGSGGRRTSGTRNGGNGGAGYIRISYATPPNITPFNDLSFCGTIYPTAYQIVSFSLKERLATDFGRNQAGRTIILTLPAGFEFNPAAAHTVTKNGGGSDITALTLTSVTITAITITLSTSAANPNTNFDEIFFNNFEIRAISAGSGNLIRLSSNPGTFLIRSTTQNPLSSESFGFMFSNPASVYNSSEVTQYTSDNINRNCESSRNSVILRIKVSITDGCPPPVITQFNFSTNGDAGFSQNPLSNISSAKVYYNGLLIGAPTINSNTPVFGTVASPNGAFTINGSQKLDMGTGDYYFFLAYDVPATANIGDGIDASLTSFVMDGSTINNMSNPNPNGYRIIVDQVCFTPDEPNPPANLELVPRGSYVIPMDNTNQSLVAPFNIKAYGLVHSLLMNDIPVRWVILSGKTKDAVDFTANASRVYPTVIGSAPVNFKASAFIVDSTWVNKSFYATGKTATQVINDYYARGARFNQVTVYMLTNDETLDIRYTLHQRPKIAVFSNGGFQAIHKGMLDSAGVTNYFIQSAGNFNGLAECYTFCSEAHWDFATNPDVNPVFNVMKFVNEGGNFLAQCAGIDLYEDHQPSGGHFHTNQGIRFSNTATTNTFSNPDLGFNQFEGIVTTNMGSTIRLFWPGVASAFNSKTYACISAPLPTNNMVATGAHVAANDSIGGNVFYLGGHNYNGDMLIQHINGVRMYLNATLIPSARPTAFTLDAGSNVAICTGQSTTLGGSPTGGSAATNYIWSPTTGLDNPNSANPVASPTTTTTYTVIANDNGCPGGPSSVTVTVNPLPAAPTATNDGPVCPGATLNLNASNIPGATYTWTGPNGFTSNLQNPSISGVTSLNAGVYSVVANLNGCDGPAGTTTVVVNSTPSTPIASNNGPLCDGSSLSLTASNIVGATYSWTGPNGFTSSVQNPTIPVISVNDTGTYSVIATVNGCNSLVGTTYLMVYPIPSPPTASSNSPLCTGATLNLTASNISGATYSWTGPNGFSSALQNPSLGNVTLADAGTFSVVATVNGCPSSAGTTNVVISIPPAAPTASSNSPICEGSTLNLTASNIVGATYSWTGPNGFSSTTQNPSISGITIAGAGVYSVNAIINGCAGSVGTTNVTVNPIPATPTASSNSPVCTGTTLNLTANNIAGATYSWTGPNGFSSSVQNPSISGITSAGAGVYSVSVTVSGCTGSAGTTTVTVNTTPSAPTASSNSPLCTGATLNLTSSNVAGATYSWTGPNGFISALQNPSLGNVTLADAGTFSVVATVNGCPSSAGTTNVVISIPPAAPTASSNSPICEGSTLNLTASNIVGATYSWTGPNGFSSTTQNPSISGITVAGAGVYSVNAIINGCAGSVGTTNVTVNPIPATPTASSNSPICEGSTLNLTASNIVGATYSWTGPNGFSSSTQNPSISGITSAGAGVYSVSVTVSGCTGSAGTTTVVINPIPSAPTASNNSPLCEGQTLNLTASNIAGATYSWTGPNGFSSSIQNPTIAGITNTGAGVYSVSVTVSGCTGSAGTTNVTINTTPPAPTVTNNGPLCEGQTLNLTASNIAGATYSWVGPNGFSSTSQNPSISGITVAGGGVYSVNATLGGCTGSNGTSNVIIYATPTAPVVASNSPVCTNSTLSFTASSIPGCTYSWTGPNGFSSSLQNPTIANVTNANTGTYIVIPTSSNGCIGSQSTIDAVVTPPITIDAGVNQTVCASSPNTILAGSVSGGTTTGIWTTSGTGSFSPSNTDLNATYTHSATDITNGTVNLTLSSTNNGGCLPVTDQITLTITPLPVVSAGTDITICSTTSTGNLSGSVTGGGSDGLGQWTTTGSGTFTPNNTTLNASYTPSAGDISTANIDLILTSTNGCNNVSDTLHLTIKSPAIVDAGVNQTVCGNNASTVLNGVITSYTGTGIWTSNGSGSFVPNATTLNSTYMPSSADTANGLITLTLTSTNNAPCPAVNDNLQLTITTAPYVNAGIDVSTCSNNAQVNLSGIISGGSSTGIWTTTGTGTFSPDNTTLTAVYNSSNADTASGTVTLVLTSTSNGNCLAVTDTTIITYTPSPIVNAGNNLFLCKNDSAQLNGNVLNGANTGIWTTSGTGTFLPNASTLNAIYVPSSSDTILGSVLFTLTSTNNAGCSAVSDTMQLTFTERPVVDAGLDVSICAGTSTSLNGMVSGSATTGFWSSSGTGTFTPNDSTLNAEYIPSLSDENNGQVTLTLVSTFSCPISDSLILTIIPTPIVNAGNDFSVCENQSSVNLSGSVGGSTSTGIWTTSGSGIFAPDNTTLNANYQFSQTDSINGSVDLILTSTNNGVCNAVDDTVTITINRLATVNAGIDISVCANNSVASLNGQISGGTNTGVWTTSGTGIFNPDSVTLNVTYIPSNADTSSGSILLTLSSTNNGSCPIVQDNLTLTFTPSPLVNAGVDDTVCANNSTIHLNGSVGAGATTGLWSSNGTGIFVPSDSLLTTDYIPSANDTVVGNVTFVLTSTNNGDCLPVTDTVQYVIMPSPKVNAGPNKFVCKGNNVQLSGQITSQSGTVQWSTTGDGAFVPNNSNLNVTYIPGTTDTTTGVVFIVLTSTNNGLCNAVTDTAKITITDKPFVDAGIDQLVCSNTSVNLNGIVSGTSITGYWSGSNGIFSPDSTSLSAVFTPDSVDLATGFVSLILNSTNACLVQDSVIINFQQNPVVNAGNDLNICVNQNTINLIGTITGSTNTGIWTTGGTGNFVPDNTDLDAVYQISQNDSINGFIQFVLTSTNNGVCNAVSDTMNVLITPIPSVNAGVDFFACANNIVNLNGSISGVLGTGYWTTNGSGIFNPDSANVITTYNFSNADTSNASLEFILHATGACTAVSDTVIVTITPAPFVNAGTDISVCANNADVLLNGIVANGSTTGVWTTNGSGSFNPDSVTFNCTYIPSVIDTANGLVWLTLTSTNNGNCIAVSDSMQITITSQPIVNAGNNMFVCNDNNVILNGTITNGTGTGIWTTSGGGNFVPDNTALNATYIPASNDTIIGSIVFTLTSTNNGGCNPVSDSIIVNFTPRPNVFAGNDVSVCSNDSVLLSGIVSGSSTTGYWTTLGGGSLVPDSSNLNAYYIPDSSDISVGFATLILTSSNACPVKDSITIAFINPPVVNAGNNINICAGQLNVNLNGIVSGTTTTGMWTTNGSGVFSPDNTSLTPTYTLSSADSANGNIMIILSSTGAITCADVSDTLLINVVYPPVFDAGSDIVACANNNPVLQGVVSSGSSFWTTSGDGTFSPDSSLLNAIYILGNNDTISASVTIYLNINNACGIYSDSLLISVTPAPFVDAGNDISTCTVSTLVQLNGIVSAGATTGVWTTTGTGSFNPSDSSLNAVYNISSSDTLNSTITFYLSSTNNGNCIQVTDSLTLTFTSSPQLFAGNNQTICNNNIAQLNGTVNNGNPTIQWLSNGSGAFSPSDTSLIATYTASASDLTNGVVQIILTSTGGTCNFLADTLSLTFLNSTSAVDIGTNQSVCYGNLITINPVILGDTGTFNWSSSGSGTFTPSDSVQNIVYTPSVADGDSGMIYIYLNYSYTCGTIKDSVLIYLNSIPTAGFTTNVNCNNMTANFTNTSAITNGAINNYFWNFNDGLTSYLQNPTHTFADSGSYNIQLIAESDSGCSDTVINVVTIYNTINAQFTMSDSTISTSNNILFTDQSVGATSWLWDFGTSTDSSTIQNPNFTYNNIGNYVVWLYITGNGGCTDSVSHTVSVENHGYAIPSGFSPNGDNNNDVFNVRGGPFSEFSMRVFDSWGKQVFVSENQNNGWDGKYKGVEQPESVYIYIFKAKLYDGTDIEIVGDLTLVR